MFYHHACTEMYLMNCCCYFDKKLINIILVVTCKYKGILLYHKLHKLVILVHKVIYAVTLPNIHIESDTNYDTTELETLKSF